jgi:hypothetical protein
MLTLIYCHESAWSGRKNLWCSTGRSLLIVLMPIVRFLLYLMFTECMYSSLMETFATDNPRSCYRVRVLLDHANLLHQRYAPFVCFLFNVLSFIQRICIRKCWVLSTRARLIIRAMKHSLYFFVHLLVDNNETCKKETYKAICCCILL